MQVTLPAARASEGGRRVSSTCVSAHLRVNLHTPTGRDGGGDGLVDPWWAEASSSRPLVTCCLQSTEETWAVGRPTRTGPVSCGWPGLAGTTETWHPRVLRAARSPPRLWPEPSAPAPGLATCRSPPSPRLPPLVQEDTSSAREATPKAQHQGVGGGPSALLEPLAAWGWGSGPVGVWGSEELKQPIFRPDFLNLRH